MANLILMAGAPGSGKSTWLHELKENTILDNTVVVSRDEIRYSLLEDSDEYFDKEYEVFKTFYTTIEYHLKKGRHVIADATHLNKNSRKKLLKQINTCLYDELKCCYFDVPLSVCLQRNEYRKGTRAYVPESALINMRKKLTYPSIEEGFDKIYKIDKDGGVTIDG